MRTPRLLGKLHRLGHDSFRVDGPPVIYIDPWKLPEGSGRADLILVSHHHYDHCSPDDVAALSGPDTVVIAAGLAAEKLTGARTIRPGESITVGDVQIEATPAYNTNKFREPGKLFHPPSDAGVGFLVTIDGERLYHTGDSDLIPEMGRIKCDVALLPVSGTYVMTAEEAFEAARTIDAQLFVPMHYGDIVGGQADVEKFRYLCEEAGLHVAVLPAEPEAGLPQ